MLGCIFAIVADVQKDTQEACCNY